MEFTILGSGTCVPSLEHQTPSYFLKVAGKNVLVDCGVATLLQLAQTKNDYKDLDYIFITHFHFDHIGCLPAIIMALKYTPHWKRQKPLNIVGPKGIKEVCDTLLQAKFAADPKDYFKLEIEEVAAGCTLEFDGFILETAKTAHSSESLAYKFSEKAKSIVFSGDTDYDEKLARFAAKADVFVLECSKPDNDKDKGHLTPSECGRMAKLANVKKLVLSHLYPGGNMDDRVKAAKKYFKNTVLAKDLLHINI